MIFSEWVVFGILLFMYLLLAVLNPFLLRLNIFIRQFILLTRPLQLRPLMVITHRYNDVLSLSLQLILLSLLMGFYWDDWRRAMVLTSAMFIQTTAVTATKQLAAATRPPQDIAHVKMRSGSYPSGHSAASMTFALLVPTMLAPYLPTAAIIAITCYLFFVAIVTAYGRLFLDVHWLSDIIGAWLISPATWLIARGFLRV
ncbi:MAG: phosphatase PAP2 family protein [Clostridiaceae bacterium]|nr:phosphatase PAP2 family protein [Clostridiaceae bacterium]